MFLRIILVTLIASVAANAQQYKKFWIGVGLGYAAPAGANSTGGRLWLFEPGYRITDYVLVNLKIENPSIVRGTVGTLAPLHKTGDIRSYTVNGQYYFNRHTIRMFAGFGAGIYLVDVSEFEMPLGIEC